MQPRPRPERSQGGLAPGLVVELSNNSMAVILEVGGRVQEDGLGNLAAWEVGIREGYRVRKVVP